MRKNLADIVSEISSAGATGILTLSMNNDPSLFKIFFKNGKAYHITHGTCKDEECLVTIADHPFVTGQFMPGAQIAMQSASVIPLEELIAVARKTNKTLEWSGRGDTGRQSEHAGVSSAVVDRALVAKMEGDLVDRVGPIASMVLTNAYDACGLKQGLPIMKPEFQRLVKIVSEQLPEEHRKPFLKQFALQGGT